MKESINGIVTDSSIGLPLPAATISVTDSSNATRTALTGTDGSYTIAGIAPGAFSGTIRKDGYAPYIFSGTISSGQTITINVALTTVLPVISSIAVTGVTMNSALITWKTDQPSDSLVEYGATNSYGNSVTDTLSVISHSIILTGLNPSATYHFKVTSSNSYGFSSSSSDNTFSTHAFMATSIGDYGNVTVMAVSGNYDAKNSDGSINALPRQEIAKEFLKNHPDQYDFFVIFSNFDFSMPDASAKAFYLEVKNDTQGIGKLLFDNSTLFGSNSKLQGTIDMGNIATITTNPTDPKFEETISILAHEQMHRWGANVKFKDGNGNNSTALLGKDGTHWSFLLDSDGSVMYGNDWRDNGDGTFTSVAANKYYSPLDLYLMGMIDKSKVPPMLLIENASVDPTRLPAVGETISGTAHSIAIDDIIAAEGLRVPDASSSQKIFKTAFIFITRPGTYTGNEIPVIENIRSAWAGRFSTLTGGKGSIADVAPTISISISSPLEGETVSKPDVTVIGLIINPTGKETGVAVNGRPATVYGDQFIASHVPLTEGPNTITVTAIDTSGNTATNSITVNAVTTGNYIRLTSNIESGIAPLEATLRIDGSFSFDESSISVSGPSQSEFLSTGVEEYSLKMIAEGIYYFTANVTGPDGNLYQDTIAIIVMNKTEIDNLLKGKWEGMKNSLDYKDTSKALTYIFPDKKTSYQDMFNALLDQLPFIVATQREFNLISIKNKVATYELVTSENGKVYSYEVIFVNDTNGVWMIYEF